MNASESNAEEEAQQRPPHWCDICSLDLQSPQSLAQHELGQKHQKRMVRLGLSQHIPESTAFPPLADEEELFGDIASGAYRNIVVLTGAGVSTAAGVPDFRSAGGFFETLGETYGGRFPGIEATPERLFSRSFVEQYPAVWKDELLPSKQKLFQDLKPTVTHKFCAYLHQKGWLKRIYTQNIDGLHLHPSLAIPKDKVVECHGSIQRGDIVLYEDPLPPSFFKQAGADFSLSNNQRNRQNGDGAVDLVLVFGTSLQVAPFCGLPNMALKGCTRVLVNRCLSDCYHNSFSGGGRSHSYYGMKICDTATIGSRKNVQLRSLWLCSRAKKKWRQLLVEDDCDHFTRRFFSFANVFENEADCDLDDFLLHIRD